MEEDLNKEKIDEDNLAKKVRSKKRIRGLLIFINVVLASYLVFEASMKIYNFASSLNNKEDIILLNNKNREESLKIYDQFLKKNNDQYINYEIYDIGIYGGYLHLSYTNMDNHFYQLKYNITSLINVTNNIYQNTFFNEETDENYLNTGINLTKLENGDYILVNEYITSDDENNKHIALKLNNINDYEKTIYTLPNENGERKKIVIKNKYSSPCLVISVSDINTLPQNYYDFALIGEEEKVSSFTKKFDKYKIAHCSSLIDAFKTNSNYSLILKDVEKTLVPSQIKIKDSFKDLVSNENIVIDDYKYYEYVTELGGNLLHAGSCKEGVTSSFVVKPYLKGNDNGKYVVVINENIDQEYLLKIINY